VAWYWPTQLDRIEDQLASIELRLDRIIALERRIMADEAALDQAIADLGSHIDEVQAAAQSIIDKLEAAGTTVDLADEIATLQGFGTKVQDTTTAITDAVAGPPAPPAG
jgi:hypothetical protein